MKIPVLLFLPALLVAQHDDAAKKARNPAIGNPAAIARGSKVWASSCAACHGPDGQGGRGPNLIRRTAWHPLTDEATFETIRNGVPGADMPPTKLPDDQTWDIVAFVHALTGPAIENHVPGDAAAGEQIYWSAKAGCSNCHAIRGRGSRLGPDLSNIGGSQPLGLIKQSILDPSKNPSRLGKEYVTVKLRSGDTLSGIARNRTNYSLQLIDRQGDLRLIDMADVSELTISSRSLMPADYAKRLPPQELRDLLAYLSRQTIRDIPPGSTQGSNSK